MKHIKFTLLMTEIFKHILRYGKLITLFVPTISKILNTESTYR